MGRENEHPKDPVTTRFLTKWLSLILSAVLPVLLSLQIEMSAVSHVTNHTARANNQHRPVPDHRKPDGVIMTLRGPEELAIVRQACTFSGPYDSSHQPSVPTAPRHATPAVHHQALAAAGSAVLLTAAADITTTNNISSASPTTDTRTTDDVAIMTDIRIRPPVLPLDTSTDQRRRRPHNGTAVSPSDVGLSSPVFHVRHGMMYDSPWRSRRRMQQVIAADLAVRPAGAPVSLRPSVPLLRVEPALRDFEGREKRKEREGFGVRLAAGREAVATAAGGAEGGMASTRAGGHLLCMQRLRGKCRHFYSVLLYGVSGQFTGRDVACVRRVLGPGGVVDVEVDGRVVKAEGPRPFESVGLSGQLPQQMKQKHAPGTDDVSRMGQPGGGGGGTKGVGQEPHGPHVLSPGPEGKQVLTKTSGASSGGGPPQQVVAATAVVTGVLEGGREGVDEAAGVRAAAVTASRDPRGADAVAGRRLDDKHQEHTKFAVDGGPGSVPADRRLWLHSWLGRAAEQRLAAAAATAGAAFRAVYGSHDDGAADGSGVGGMLPGVGGRVPPGGGVGGGLWGSGHSQMAQSAPVGAAGARPDVAAVNVRRHLNASSVRMYERGVKIDPVDKALWNLDRIDQRSGPLDGVYGFGSPLHAGLGLGVTIYSLDSGVFTEHNEFQSWADNEPSDQDDEAGEKRERAKKPDDGDMASKRAAAVDSFVAASSDVRQQLLMQQLPTGSGHKRRQPLEGSRSGGMAAKEEEEEEDGSSRGGKSTGGSRAVNGYDFVDNDEDAADCDGHGTHVASSAVGRSVGVARGSRLVAVRVLDCSGSGTISDTVAGLEWVARHAQLPAVVMMSLGVPDGAWSDVLSKSVRELVRQHGIVVVVASGNSAIDSCTVVPANVPEVLTVAASNFERKFGPTPRIGREAIYQWANTGACVDLFAPGVEVFGACGGRDRCPAVTRGSYTWASGTSMAAPLVAGVAALYLEAYPRARPEEVAAALLSGATEGSVRDSRMLPDTPNRLLYSRLDALTEPSSQPAASSAAVRPAAAVAATSGPPLAGPLPAPRDASLIDEGGEGGRERGPALLLGAVGGDGDTRDRGGKSEQGSGRNSSSRAGSGDGGRGDDGGKYGSASRSPRDSRGSDNGTRDAGSSIGSSENNTDMQGAAESAAIDPARKS